jgi:PAS domain S-box-containing protein
LTHDEGSTGEALEALLNLMPMPVLLVDPGSEKVTFANRAADVDAGGRFPADAIEGFTYTDPQGHAIPRAEMPVARAARGEPVRRLEMDVHGPRGRRSLILDAQLIPVLAGKPPTVVVCFEDVTHLRRTEDSGDEAHALLDTLFETAPIGLAYYDTDLRYIRINRALAEINGIPPEDHIGRTLEEMLPGLEPGVAETYRRIIATGEPVTDISVSGETPASPGERRHWIASGYPVEDPEGTVLGLGVVVTEVTEQRRALEARDRALREEREARTFAERAEEHARFLARASIVLDESLDPDVTLASVARLAVEGLADWCSVEAVDPDGTLRHVATAHADPDSAELARTLRETYPPDPDGLVGAPNVVRTGKSELYPDITDELLARGARSEEQLALARAVGVRSAMVVPMTTRGRVLGAISFVNSASKQRFDADDLLLAEDLARRAALSVDTARLYSERTYIARALQESLLPPQLPEIEGFDIAARYTAAGEGNEVGGDFYDVFPVGPREWGVVIGDVCGKGADAAALTALVRYTIRAVATAEREPSEVLELVNEAILRQRSDNRFCTGSYARLALDEEGGATVTFANGGHPLPVVMRADGSSEPFGASGTLLGIVPDPELTDERLRLAPGDGIVFYTDGVTEAAAPDVLLEPRDVARMVDACPEGDSSDVARCIEEAVLDEGRPTPQDDIAILVVRALSAEEAPIGARARFSAH